MQFWTSFTVCCIHRPAVVVTDKNNKKILITDVNILFENWWQAFAEAWGRKLSKYRPQANTLRDKGYDMTVQVLIVWVLGSWDQSNESVLRAFRVSHHYSMLIKYLIVSNTYVMARGHLYWACYRPVPVWGQLAETSHQKWGWGNTLNPQHAHSRLAKTVNAPEYPLSHCTLHAESIV